MINESLYWKEELFRNARWLVEALNKKRWTERSFSKLEKSIMISAYAIRKLNEASKVPSEYMEKDIPVGLFYRKKSFMDKLNNHSIEKHYELSNEEVSSIKVKHLFNQIIHSYIFCPVLEEQNQLTGILINSDKTCKHRLYNVQIKKLIDIIMYISNGNMTSAKFTKIDGQFVMSEVVYESSVNLSDIG